MLGTAFDLLLVILGFGFIVFVHELGHFLAARWAGIRVLAFAVGFGPSLLTYRKGVGFRAGTSEPEYLKQLRNTMDAAVTAQTPEAQALDQLHRRMSPTEYRLNALPFGGYVKMLGQEDLNPTATSSAPDSYQNCSPWRRMVVISAGVIMNIITAAILFIIVMMVGRQVDSPIVGFVQRGSPAMAAVDAGTGAAIPLTTRDRVVAVDGKTVRSFDDIALAVAMAKKDTAVTMTVERPGAPNVLNLLVTPREDRASGMLAAGFGPQMGTTLDVAWDERELPRGSVLTSVNGVPAKDGHAVDVATQSSSGDTVTTVFTLPDGTTKDVALKPVAEMQLGLLPSDDARSYTAISHVLGLPAVLRIGSTTEAAAAQGLQRGDIIARVGNIEFPSMATGIREIRANKGGSVDMTLLRKNESGAWTVVRLTGVKVNRKGQIGLGVGDSSSETNLIAAPMERVTDAMFNEYVPGAAGTPITAGARVVAVDDQSTATLHDVVLRVREAVARGATVVTLTIRRPVAGDLLSEGPDEMVPVEISAKEVEQIKALGWTSELSSQQFATQQQTMKASNPLEALRFGFDETKRVMGMTYLTFARLAQGTVKVEHLKGPVGIAHLGTLVADRGFIWLLFFLALISVNLAVINFLPLPIVDGGQFLFLLYEAIRGRPVPVQIQNGVTMVGLVLIAGMFLLVTFNDVKNLLGL